MSMIYFLPILLVILFTIGWYFQDTKGIKRQIVKLSKLDTIAIIDEQKNLEKADTKQENLHFQLVQAGLTKKEYNEGKLVFAIIGLVLAIALPLFFSFTIGLIGIVLGILIIIFGGKIYLYISKNI